MSCLGPDMDNSGGVVASGGVVEGQTDHPPHKLRVPLIILVLGLHQDASKGVDHTREEIVGDIHQERQKGFLQKEISLDSYPLMAGKVLRPQWPGG